jgi:hypothetical protein
VARFFSVTVWPVDRGRLIYRDVMHCDYPAGQVWRAFSTRHDGNAIENFAAAIFAKGFHPNCESPPVGLKGFRPGIVEIGVRWLTKDYAGPENRAYLSNPGLLAGN